MFANGSVANERTLVMVVLQQVVVLIITVSVRVKIYRVRLG